jgi:hypothetical protein
MSTGTQAKRTGWGVNHVLWLRSTAPRIPDPPLWSHKCTPFFHLPCFLQNHLTGDVLISEVRCSSWLLRFALLTSTAQDYLPKSKQNGLTLPRKRLGAGSVSYRSVPMQLSREVSVSVWTQTDPHSWPQKNPPILRRWRRVWQRFWKYYV